MSVHDYLIDLTAFFASKLRNSDLVNSLYIFMKILRWIHLMINN